jgi:hypothetical protein
MASLVGTDWLQAMAKMPWRSTRSRTAALPLVASQASSRTSTSYLRPLMPPVSFADCSVARQA